MLQKFLFIGVGGSGGKTLRLLRAELEKRLEQVGYTDPFPGAWRFLHIDVPAKPDGDDPSLPPQLPPECYVGLASHGVPYREIDGLLTGRGVGVLDHTAGWRPDPKEVNVTPIYGAGQYRAVGRVVAGAAMGDIVKKIQDGVNALSQIDVDTSLGAVSRALGDDSPTPASYPVVLVVSSVAGGSGAGTFLDVCDALRLLGKDWQRNSSAILYTPDVFEDLSPTNRNGVYPNALASLCELLAGYWNAGDPASDEFAILESAGLFAPRVDRRGPRFPFLVGMGNDRVRFTRQVDVYRAVARSLASWVTSLPVQSRLVESVLGNWTSNAAAVDDAAGLFPGAEAPVSSLGYASVSLGRDRLERFVTEQLAGASVERLLKGHVSRSAAEEEGDEAAQVRVAEENYWTFLEAAGLRELGQEHNDILDAIRGGGTHEARRDDLLAVRSRVVSAVVDGKPKGMEPNVAAERVTARLKDHRVTFLTEQQARDLRGADAWVRAIQPQVLEATASALARVGAPATAKVLQMAISELDNEVVPELVRDAGSYRRHMNTLPQRVMAVFNQVQAGGVLAPENPLIDQGVKEGTDSYWYEAEAHLHELAAALVVDFVQNFLKPLKVAIDHARSGLETDSVSTPERTSPVDRWRQPYVPRDLEPAENEALLEPTAGYPAQMEELVKRTTEAADSGSGTARAVRDVVSGSTETRTGAQQVIGVLATWSPSPKALSTEAGAQNGRFDVRIRAKDLYRRTHDWVRRPNTVLGDHIRESLVRYLDPAGVDPAVHDKRIKRFADAFTQAMNTSQPFVKVDPLALLRFHGSKQLDHARVLTKVPFPVGHPARDVVRGILLREPNMDEPAVERVFGDGEEPRIEITSFLAHSVNPFVLGSVTDPIMSDLVQRRTELDTGNFWTLRRARPLPQFVPLPPDVRLAMVRGWFTARALGYIDAAEHRTQPITVWSPSGSWPFPFPVLGSPVFRKEDSLPAVLESLPIALLETAKRGDAALQAYRRLLELGTPDADADPDHCDLHPELAAWVATGAARNGGSGPNGVVHVDRSSRLDAIEDLFARSLEYFQGLEKRLTPESALHVSRGFELRDDLTRALGQLLGMVERARAARETSDVY
jgi:hypothetical protein